MSERSRSVRAAGIPVEDAVLQLVRAFSGEAGVCALHAGTGERIVVNDQRRFPAASALKIFVLVALYQAAADRTVDLEQRLQVRYQDFCEGSGVLAHLRDEVSLTLRDLATLMMMVSDNTAANLLIDALGTSRVRATIDGAALHDTHFEGRIDFSRLAHDKSRLGWSCPSDMARFMLRLYRNEILPPELGSRVIDILRIQKYVEPMRRLLPVDPYARDFGAHEPVWVASKTGSLDGVRVEVGLIHTERASPGEPRQPGEQESAWALCVMSERCADLRVTSENEGVRLIAEVSRAVFDAWSV